MDVKARVTPIVARDIGWQATASVVPALIVADTTTNRRRVRQLAPLLGRYELRGREAAAWLRRPVGTPSGLLMLVKLPNSAGADVRRAGRRRVRLKAADPRSRRRSERCGAGSNNA